MTAVDLVKIGKTIKMRRIERGISQTEFAKGLGISQTHLCNVENGRAALGLKGLLQLKEIFQCTLDELVDPEGYALLQQKRRKRPRILRVIAYE